MILFYIELLLGLNYSAVHMSVIKIFMPYNGRHLS